MIWIVFIIWLVFALVCTIAEEKNAQRFVYGFALDFNRCNVLCSIYGLIVSK